MSTGRLDWDATHFEHSGPRSETALVVKAYPSGWTWSASFAGLVFATGKAASSSAAKGAVRKAFEERAAARAVPS